MVLIVGFLFLTGCQSKLEELPDNPIIFKTGELNVQDEDTGYKTIEYNDKVYIMYGDIKAKGLLRNISYVYGECLGYEEDNQSHRIYALADESADEWLIEYNIDGFMENPDILREITKKIIAKYLQALSHLNMIIGNSRFELLGREMRSFPKEGMIQIGGGV